MSVELFPVSQVIVVGGTGQTGHRLLMRLCDVRPHAKVYATSRTVGEDGFPSGDHPQLVKDHFHEWKTKVSWHGLNLEADGRTLKERLRSLGLSLDPKASTVLLFSAAFTNVEVCETDPPKCNLVNEQNTIAVLQWARRLFNAKLVFYSTDYVFDGQDGPYSESDSKNPLSQYGRSKAVVEEWLERNAPEASLILRTTGVYDYLPGSKNFLMQMLDLWSQGKTTRIPADQFANPTWADDLARATLELIAAGSSGVFHVAGASHLARHEFARLIAKVFGCQESLILPVRTNELHQKARRPLKGGLKTEKLEAKLGWAPAGVQKVLEYFKTSF
ncbi:MAG: SDR family oxidoreductase [Bdellovibrionota bacterium]